METSNQTKRLSKKSSVTASRKELKIKQMELSFEQPPDSSQDVGFTSKFLIGCTLPHSKVSGTFYERSYNNKTLTIRAQKDGEIPFGPKSRLLLAWLITKASQMTQQTDGPPVIDLGSSLREFLRVLNIPYGASNVAMFKQQLKFLASANILVNQRTTAGQVIENFSLINRACISWDADPSNDKHANPDPGRNLIILSSDFYRHLRQSKIPFDWRVIRVLQESSLELDLYFFLTYTSFNANDKIQIKYDDLKSAIGSGYADTSQGRYSFRKRIIKALADIAAVYPALHMTYNEKHLVVHPTSSPSVPRIGSKKIMSKINPSKRKA